MRRQGGGNPLDASVGGINLLATSVGGLKLLATSVGGLKLLAKMQVSAAAECATCLHFFRLHTSAGVC